MMADNSEKKALLISVVVPSYKPQSYLWDCLDSIRDQSIEHRRYETIVVLNGCNEPYKSQIENYIKKYEKEWTIRLIQTDIPGVSNARNLGIEASQGEFLSFVDDDDVVSDCFLAELLTVSSNDCIGCSNSVSFAESIELTGNNFLTKAYQNCYGKKYSLMKYRQFLSPPVCKLIHKDIIGDIRFPVDLAKSEDSVFCLMMTPRIKEMKLASEGCIYYQRKRKGSAMRTKNSFWYELKALFKLETAYLKTWARNLFSYQPLFVLSRMVGGLRNFLLYINK